LATENHLKGSHTLPRSLATYQGIARLNRSVATYQGITDKLIHCSDVHGLYISVPDPKFIINVPLLGSTNQHAFSE
jgi:hypothetical protein